MVPWSRFPEDFQKMARENLPNEVGGAIENPQHCFCILPSSYLHIRARSDFSPQSEKVLPGPTPIVEALTAQSMSVPAGIDVDTLIEDVAAVAFVGEAARHKADVRPLMYRCSGNRHSEHRLHD